MLLNDPTYVEAARVLAAARAPGSGRRCRSARRACCSARPPRGAATHAEAARARWTLRSEQTAITIKKQPAAGREADLPIGASQARQTWKPRNWPHGPRSPAPSSTWTRPSPRNNSESDNSRTRVISSRAPAPASGSPRSVRCLRRTASPRPRPAHRRPARPAAFRAQGQARHLPAPVGRPVADRPVRLQADARQARRHRTARQSVRMGQRITGMTSGQSTLPGGAVHLQVPAARASPAPGSANCCRTPRRSSTTSRSSRR